MKKHYLIAILGIIILTGCKPQEVIIERTEFKDRLQIDTFIVKQSDSVFVKQKGDTIWFEKYKTMYRERIKIQKDTVNIQRTDTVVKNVVKKEVVIQKTHDIFWYVGLIGSILFIVWLILWIKKRLMI